MNDFEQVLGFAEAMMPPELRDDRRLILLTVANVGYTALTINMIRSLGRQGFPTNACVVACFDDEAVEKVAAAGSDFTAVRVEEQVARGFIRYDQRRQFGPLMAAKVRAVRAAMDAGHDVIYVDGDVVWLRPGGPQAIEAWFRGPGEGRRLVFQQDGLGRPNDEVCCGLYYAPNNDRARILLDVEALPVPPADRKFDDQKWVNSRLWSQPLERGAPQAVERLPLDLFPNGKYLRERLALDRAKLLASPALCLHLNWLIGRQKLDAMERLGLWVLPEQGQNGP